MRKLTIGLVAAIAWTLSSGVAWSQTATCGDLDWGAFEAEYPGIGSACQGVVYRNGIAYAKFKAKMVRRFNDGSVNLRIIRPDGTWFVETFNPPDDFIVETAAGPMTFAMVPAMGDINVYVPEGERFTIVSVVEEDETVEIVEAYVAPPPAAAEPVALPTTASPLPLIGLAGGLFVALGGLIAGIRRRRG
jgi:hypothetical protein